MTTKNVLRVSSRWTTLRAWAPTLVFLVVAILCEYLVVLYAMSLGAEDPSLVQWSFQIPGSDWNVTLAVSPLFHLVPIAGIAALVSSWMYLTRQIAMRPQQSWKGKVGPATRKTKTQSRVDRIFGQFLKKVRMTKPTVRSAVLILAFFGLFIVTVSLLTYPDMIYRGVTNAYRSNPSLLGFVKGTSQALAPVGSALSTINGALLSASPGFRDFAIGVGNTIKPLATLDGAGKYLVFQNAAAWIAALLALFYVEYTRKGFRYVRK
jgi:uncharacterized membrane protein YciS (DUF1049 family)